MPMLHIVDSYSHMFGQSVLATLHPDLSAEIMEILTDAVIPPASKKSRERSRAGQLVWSGKDFNGALAPEFRRLGWERRKLYYPGQSRYFIDVDFCKGAVSVELQFGKYAFVQHDFAKFRYLFEAAEEDKRVDVGVEVVPCASLQRQMYTGPANFESVAASLKAHARNDPPVPIWLLAIDAQE